MLMNHEPHAGIHQWDGTFTSHSTTTIVSTTVLPTRVTLVTSAGYTISIRKKKIDVFNTPFCLKLFYR
jgi:hypothetical protein